MDVKEKRKALGKACFQQAVEKGGCKRCIFYAPHACECSIDIEDAPDEMIHKWHAMAFPEADTPSGGIDYEAEYHKLLAEKEKLKEEIKYMQMGAREIRENNDILRAKLDMIYLIFGGANR